MFTKKRLTTSLVGLAAMFSVSANANSIEDFFELSAYAQYLELKEMEKHEILELKSDIQLAVAEGLDPLIAEPNMLSIITFEKEDLRNGYWNEFIPHEDLLFFARNELFDLDFASIYDLENKNSYINRHAMQEGIAPSGVDGKQVGLCRLFKSSGSSYFEVAGSDIEHFIKLSGSKMTKDEACLNEHLSKTYWQQRYDKLSK